MTRKEAIDILKNTIVRFGRFNGKMTYAEALQIAIQALEEPHWIPCSEATDIPDCEVLCCDMWGEMIVGYLDRNDESNTGWWADSDGVCLMDVVAYMPLPEAWRGDEE